ncbi:uncharacterized protein EV420DRAFT_1735087 [Desarmillaria tabescens]|uniref:ER-bound oxygenase mpaB/mpaB'/Rubber oxygenase catalytic domain-containing protein n=1 Tax=Armillaria tabescens TaxID=1929756 RepID=A0AA39NBH0_ARMTA|nr:uncharacterized protein EV420DRAFT_1735087 [Desarmillaria tabescens]KAK0462534.1 hypothetical protein EV420DRAFT_1735087 [Desarmillaria tabescens]
MPDWPTGNLQAVGLACLGYLSLVKLLRWRRYNTVHEKYTPKYKAGTLTLQDAQEIISVSMMYDMPALMNYALAFALFKTYAIPSISKLLFDTQELSHPDKISKRYADVTTWMFCPISGKPMTNIPEDEKCHEEDPRANITISRVNWLHSRYKIRWAERFGWRALSELERSALLMYWTEIGHRMNIKDIPETWEELVQWSQKYEENMVPAQTNHDVASLTTEELLHVVPESFGIKNFARRISICLLDDRVRITMMSAHLSLPYISPSDYIHRQPAQPWYLHAFTRAVLHTFSFIQHHLCIPRSKGELIVSAEMPKFDSRDGPVRMHPTRWQPKPWYKPQTTSLWGSLKDRLAVLIGFYDEMPGKKYKTDGYILEEIPDGKETMRMAEDMQGCPIRAPWFVDIGTAAKVER